MVEYFAPGAWQGVRCSGGCDNCEAAAKGGVAERDLAAEARLLLATVQVCVCVCVSLRLGRRGWARLGEAVAGRRGSRGAIGSSTCTPPGGTQAGSLNASLPLQRLREMGLGTTVNVLRGSR